jgi:2-(1,2-epoxy-1,2-dihydrophenyl)acetyl-CoA isomerase
MGQVIEIEKKDGTAWVWLNRTERYNAFDLDMMDFLSRSLVTLAVEEEVRAVVISGRGKAFCAGGDLGWVGNYQGGAAAAFHELAARFHLAILEIRRMAKPVIGAINGVAAGGGFSLALACDFRVMAKSAVLRQGYTSSGLCIDGGGTYMLPRLVGLARAMEIAAYDQPITSQQAFEWGLATRIVDDDQVLEEARTMALELSGKSLHSFGWSKQLLTDSMDTPLETQLEKERSGLSICSAHPDGQEGIRAFLEKRKPVFTSA